MTRPRSVLKGWITIGGSPGDEGEHEGGTHVFVGRGGKIEAGPQALEGKPLSRLRGGKKPAPAAPTPTSRLGQPSETEKPAPAEPAPAEQRRSRYSTKYLQKQADTSKARESRFEKMAGLPYVAEEWSAVGKALNLVGVENDGTVEGAKKALLARTQEWVNRSHLYLRLPAEYLNRVLSDGRFRNQFETNTSRGAFDPEKRLRRENTVMGVRKSVEAKDRPVYGYFGPPGEDSERLRENVGSYGEVRVRLKEAVRDRATATMCDSFDDTALAAPAKALDDKVLLATVMGQYFTGEPDDKARKRMQSLLSDPAAFSQYVEAQYHGGVSVQDIEEVMFHKRPSRETVQKLENLGIKWSVGQTVTE